MPVIGRLDGQVDELLISPISKRRRDEELSTPDEAAPDPLPAPTTQTPAPVESSAERDELPVWLL